MNLEIDQKWLSQFRKGFLELCVLLALTRCESSYGFELLQVFKANGLEVGEGTLYPLLNRMHKNGWIDSVWKPPEDGGHPRRFYSLNNVGKDMLQGMLKAHEHNQNIVKNLLEEK